ncbi:MAG: filamentous hemagglutinin family protein [Psychroserpens sp.]|jgi:filamentous hemagglutinin family protein
MKTPLLNHAYRLFWCHVLNAWVTVSEATKGHGKSSGKRLFKRSGAALAASALLLPPVFTFADQTGGAVVAGAGSITQTTNLTTINQASQTLGLTWDTFNINAGQTVNFVQPNAAALAVNRILDTNGSRIMGNLNANGQVWLINPNGVFFGAGSQINIGSVLASTLNPLSNTGDMDQVFGNGGTASVINQGNITAANGGYVAMLGNKVINEGVITAQMGAIALGAGSKVSLQFSGNKLLGLTVNESTLNNLAENNQLIKADGGLVFMSAGAKDSILASTVNNTGVIEAHTLQEHNGTIFLMGGMAAGTTNVAGTLDASAAQGNGGFIETSAANVRIEAGTKITTKAENGETGTWLIDPTDFNIEAGTGVSTTSSIGATTLSTNLDTTGVQIQTLATGTENGDINVNGAVSWASDNNLTLTAHKNININQSISATGATAKINLEYGQANLAAGNTSDYHINNGAQVNLQAGDNFTTKLGSNGVATEYKVITQLGVAGSAAGTTLQGINGNLLGSYVLGNNIDASATSGWNGSQGFNPIGNLAAQFTGTFDGLGHTVDSLLVNRPGSDYSGLFGWNASGTIKNVGITNVSITGKGFIGGLVGRSTGNISISNSYATGVVSGDFDVGGLVGYKNGADIITSYATADVSGGGDRFGGLVGHMHTGDITNIPIPLQVAG